MSDSGNGYRALVERIGPDLSRIDAGDDPLPFVASALRTVASVVDDTRREVLNEIRGLRADMASVKGTLNRLLFAVVALLCAVISATIVLAVQ